ncbi:EAL domain-containing protein [Methylomonas methanica]|uniref:Response regulator receiver modulated diguanylate cyclase/phosphodiesterase n=1 Tax=Methylomonas methanica (strain DSM 25384 / MC09) TaxID=857087 RepID=G0A358_METMM|nr:EAL domain-containing protein [Methylomonas methanica]AEF98990.1 response regulator receiver modulated diguanylate cyclase/phosphodiesterase [Methylomonas methanica MC09]
MTVCDPIKEKIIIVAEHDSVSANQIALTLQENGFSDVRHASRGEQIYDILRPFHDRPEKIGLIILNDALPNCQSLEMSQSLSCATDGSVIPFVILRSEANQAQTDTGQCLIYQIDSPADPRILMLAIHFLMQLKRERTLRQQQEEQLINELASKSVIEAKLKFLAAHDELTGLVNRNTFERQLRLIMNLSNKLKKEGALLFIDVDRFSLINELEGFDVGDRLLVELTILVRKLVPASSLFARIGADEFCLFLENKTKKQAHIIAETIRTTVENFRFFTGEICYSASVSIGITSLDNASPAQHPGEMILHSRQACNFAKINGRDKVKVYNQDDVAIKERRRDIYWVPIIRKALRESDFFLMFQPVVQLNNGDISHYEVLIRMRGEDGKTITPDQFIPVAERMGLIHAIDLWVVENAIDFLATLPSYMSRISLAINLSGSAFQYPDLLQTIREKLELTWVDAGRLTFEITETAAVDNFERTRDMINKIRDLGCKFALDDFGAGFCSFNYLKTFPVDYVKIDGQFIRHLEHNETDRILVKSMVEIAGKLGKQTIAEFVETPNIALRLKDIGVNLGQGYAFGRPERNLLDGHQVSLAIILNSNSPEVSNGEMRKNDIF